MVFLSFSTVMTYSIMSLNQNEIIYNEIQIQDKELKLIKNKLIYQAVPLISENEFALPFGQESIVEGKHLLPTTINTPLTNRMGFYYQYCPFGSYKVDASQSVVSMGSSKTYDVDLISINEKPFVSYSNLIGYEGVAAFIISYNEEDTVANCDEIMYDENLNVYYLLNGKVETIYQDEIATFNELTDMSGVKLLLSVNQSNHEDMLDLISNDKSNKNYIVKLEDDVLIENNYHIQREHYNNVTVKFDFNGHMLAGEYNIEFNNVDAFLENSFDSKSSNKSVSYSFIDSNSTINASKIGSVYLDNSNLIFENNVVLDSGGDSQFNNIFHSINSDVVFRDQVVFNSDNQSTSFIYLVNSELFSNDADLLFDGNTSNYAMNIDYGSIFTTINTDITLKDINDKGVRLSGVWNTDGTISTISVEDSNLSNLFYADGGELSLNNVSVLITGISTLNTVILEGQKFKYISGAADIKNDGKCWEGEVFKNNDDSSNGNVSSSNKQNNNSYWNCF